MIKCDICGGQLEMQVDEVAICNNCGMKYSKEFLREKVSQNSIVNSTINFEKVSSNSFDIRGGILNRYIGSEEYVQIPDHVIKIGPNAFENCPGVKAIRLHNGIQEIGECAFLNCENLTNINLPTSIREVKTAMFAGCKSLKNIELPLTLEKIGERAFMGCERIIDIKLPRSIISIGSSAFENCKSLKELYIPEQLSEIEERTFKGCVRLEQITLPKVLKKIKYEAFSGCESIRNITVPQEVEILCGSYYVDYEDDTPWKYGAFYGCKNLVNINLPKTIKVLGNELFYDCKNLKSVNNIEDPIDIILLYDTYLRCEIFDKDSPLGIICMQHKQWQMKGLCRYCGGGVKGFFHEECKKCGRRIDYKRN